MTPVRFGQLLRQPALLAGQNATELEELIGRYPWCGPLRRLRYEKALLDGDEAAIELWRRRAEPYLQRAARAAREQRLATTSPTRAEAHFDFAGEREGEATAGALADDATQTHDAAYPSEDRYDVLAAAALAAEATETIDWYLKRTGHDTMTNGRPAPTPKESLESYRAWQDRRANTSWRDLLSFRKGKAGDKPSRSAKSPAKADVVRKPEVASETLAELLAEQGHTAKAVRMYRQLALRYPTRRAAFAARIDQLLQTPA